MFNLLSERSRQGYLGNRSEMNASLNRGIDSQLRIDRVIGRTHNVFSRALLATVGVAPQAGFYYEALRHELQMQMTRRFGIVDRNDAAYFFEHSGRGSYVVKKWREVLDRRRREAYVRLRSWLPIELAQRILRMNASFATYAVSDGRWRRAEQLD